MNLVYQYNYNKIKNIQLNKNREAQNGIQLTQKASTGAKSKTCQHEAQQRSPLPGIRTRNKATPVVHGAEGQ